MMREDVPEITGQRAGTTIYIISHWQGTALTKWETASPVHRVSVAILASPLSRTIADLEGADEIGSPHVAEAVGYRSLDRTYWT